MGGKILALVENTIGTSLLLSSQFSGLGYEAIVLSSPIAFRKRVEEESFDWIILDEAALPPVRRRFLDHLRRHRKGARIVWCGRPPRGTGVPIEATLEKPLRYAEIKWFFSAWASRDRRAASNARNGLPDTPAGKQRMPSPSVEHGDRSIPDQGVAAEGPAEGDGEE